MYLHVVGVPDSYDLPLECSSMQIKQIPLFYVQADRITFGLNLRRVYKI